LRSHIENQRRAQSGEYFASHGPGIRARARRFRSVDSIPASAFRVNSQTFTVILISLGVLLLIALLARNFRNYSLRVKVMLGILVPGSVALGILAFFAITRA